VIDLRRHLQKFDLAHSLDELKCSPTHLGGSVDSASLVELPPRPPQFSLDYNQGEHAVEAVAATQVDSHCV